MKDVRRGLVVGIANDHSIAWGCAEAMHAEGAELAITYLNAKAESYVAPLAQAVDAQIFLPLDMNHPEQLTALVEAITTRWGRLDFLVHSIAFAPLADLRGRLTDSSAAGFAEAMDISCHSLIRLTRAFESIMAPGSSILTMSYLGAGRAVPNYNLMGPVKAALEASVRYLALELGSQGIRVNALSPGPVPTRAASGLAAFDALVTQSLERSPLHQPISIEQVGQAAAFLLSTRSGLITGQTLHVDGGFGVVV
jgi:enoyl-[acyl-carrier protein] reductase I